jgi:hypothetical protein
MKCGSLINKQTNRKQFSKNKYFDMNGIGEKQLKQAFKTQQNIFDILADGQWHRKKEILQKAERSKIVVNKHLNAMILFDKILRRENTECGQYPTPVEYKLSQLSLEYSQFEIDQDREIKEIEKKTGMEFSKEAYNKYLEILQKEKEEKTN